MKHRARRLLAIVLIFLLVGPPIGGVALVYAAELPNMRSMDHMWMPARRILDAAALVFGMSYVIGGLPAATAGLFVGMAQVFRGGATWLWALASGLVVGIGFVIGMFALLVMTGKDMRGVYFFSIQTGVLILVCVLCTFVCWALVRAWYRLAPPAHGTAS